MHASFYNTIGFIIYYNDGGTRMVLLDHRDRNARSPIVCAKHTNSIGSSASILCWMINVRVKRLLISNMHQMSIEIHIKQSRSTAKN
jgi:hypothetical protein